MEINRKVYTLIPKGRRKKNTSLVNYKRKKELQGSHRAGMNAISQPRDRSYLPQSDLKHCTSLTLPKNFPVKKSLG